MAEPAQPARVGRIPGSEHDATRGASSSVGRLLHWSWLGRRPYGPTFALQEEIRRQVRYGEGPERLLLLEHDAVFTLGRNADRKDVLADDAWLRAEGVEIYESNRGGQVTYHGPGQLVGYPIIDLSPDRRDIGRYVHDLQEALVRTLEEIGVRAFRREGKDHVGVWVEDPSAGAGGPSKIASIGVHLSRWITIHGFALNVETDLARFGGIVACGLPDVRMTSIEQCLGTAPPLETLAEHFARHLARVLDRQLIEDSPAQLPSAEPAPGATAARSGEGAS